MEPTVKTCPLHPLTQLKAFPRKGRPDFSYQCKICNVKRVAESRRKLKLTLVEQMGGKCCRCGYNKYIGALDFHHLDPTQKDFSISDTGNTRSLKKALEEVKKCILVCSNCHREIHQTN